MYFEDHPTQLIGITISDNPLYNLHICPGQSLTLGQRYNALLGTVLEGARNQCVLAVFISVRVV